MLDIQALESTQLLNAAEVMLLFFANQPRDKVIRERDIYIQTVSYPPFPEYIFQVQLVKKVLSCTRLQLLQSIYSIIGR